VPITSVEETTGLVLLVPFPLGEVEWVARIMQTQHGDKEQLRVVQAFTSDGRQITAKRWDKLLEMTGQAEEFWRAVMTSFLLQRAGTKVAQA
jgi:hypothetical protein